MKTAIVALVLATILISSCTFFATTENIADNEETIDDNIEEDIIKDLDDVETELADDIDLDELNF